MRESIRGYTDAVIEDARNPATPGLLGRLVHPRSSTPEDPASLSDDVGAVRDLVDGSAELRGVLSDPGVPAHARRSVVSDLLGSQIGGGALRMVLYAIETGRPAELTEDLTWLTTRTVAARDGLHVSGPSMLGHHAALERLDGYADSVLSQVDDNADLAEIEDELFRFERIVGGSEDLTEALTGRDRPADARAGLVTDLLGSKATPATVQLAAYASTIGRPRDYLELLKALVARVAAETNRRIADVRAVIDLDDTQRERLAAALSRIVGQRVEVRVTVDPGVLGGFVATIGDTVVDGSVRHRLDLLKERLALSEATPNDQGAPS